MNIETYCGGGYYTNCPHFYIVVNTAHAFLVMGSLISQALQRHNYFYCMSPLMILMWFFLTSRVFLIMRPPVSAAAQSACGSSWASCSHPGVCQPGGQHPERQLPSWCPAWGADASPSQHLQLRLQVSPANGIRGR